MGNFPVQFAEEEWEWNCRAFGRNFGRFYVRRAIEALALLSKLLH
jgi:hypothetical protein